MASLHPAGWCWPGLAQLPLENRGVATISGICVITVLLVGVVEGSMPSWGGLQVFRMSLYISLPVLATVVYSDPVVMRQIITKLNYIIYPAEGPRPPVGEEMDRFRKGGKK